MSFISETEKNEEELKQLELIELDAKAKFEKASKKLEDYKDSGHEFEMDEQEVSISEKMPTLRQEYQSLAIQKGQIEQNLTMTNEKLNGLMSDLGSLKQEIESWRIQIVKSPEKIKRTQENARSE